MSTIITATSTNTCCCNLHSFCGTGSLTEIIENQTSSFRLVARDIPRVRVRVEQRVPAQLRQKGLRRSPRQQTTIDSLREISSTSLILIPGTYSMVRTRFVDRSHTMSGTLTQGVSAKLSRKRRAFSASCLHEKCMGTQGEGSISE